MKQKNNKLAQFKQWILRFVIGRYFYYLFNILVGLVIALLTYPFRLIGGKIGLKSDICSWLDKHFPLPDDNAL